MIQDYLELYKANPTETLKQLNSIQNISQMKAYMSNEQVLELFLHMTREQIRNQRPLPNGFINLYELAINYKLF